MKVPDLKKVLQYQNIAPLILIGQKKDNKTLYQSESLLSIGQLTVLIYSRPKSSIVIEADKYQIAPLQLELLKNNILYDDIRNKVHLQIDDIDLNSQRLSLTDLVDIDQGDKSFISRYKLILIISVLVILILTLAISFMLIYLIGPKIPYFSNKVNNVDDINGTNDKNESGLENGLISAIENNEQEEKKE